MRKRSWGFLVGGLLVALLLAGVVSNFASGHPDGLDSSLREGCTFDADDTITGGDCPARQEKEHEIGGPLADYGISGVDNDFLSTGLSGVLGVLLTFAVGAGGFWLLRRRSPNAADDPADDHPAAEDHPADTAGRAGDRGGAATAGPVG
ncbi:PDGLE domain-containing protein [Micromonospora sp. WMMD882]|uniref:PDGLE domain-containing protein n=1 Tax=Micromonospora sp. WMMD882 TaxID=3015151 RepID=UPI00248B2D2B|nr:PDGLE domain-containing protein [Micromonospora sp. WMMD882]WBB82161.1 PDGLE domain-containing protein [Micromonospora sp. WMMD882]